MWHERRRTTTTPIRQELQSRRNEISSRQKQRKSFWFQKLICILLSFNKNEIKVAYIINRVKVCQSETFLEAVKCCYKEVLNMLVCFLFLNVISRLLICAVFVMVCQINYQYLIILLSVSYTRIVIWITVWGLFLAYFQVAKCNSIKLLRSRI